MARLGVHEVRIFGGLGQGLHGHALSADGTGQRTEVLRRGHGGKMGRPESRAGEVSQQQQGLARSILGALGEEIYVPDEKYIDMATAVSGSGPAYFFLVIEALVDAAVHIGLHREMAEELALQTVLGAACLARETGKQPKELRDTVTSPGGTTAAGLAKLEEGGLRDLFMRAVIAAHERAKELGR